MVRFFETQIFAFFRLDVTILDNRVEYKLFPIHPSPRVIMRHEIRSLTVKPKPRGVYGLKIKRTLEGKIYYMGGDHLIRIVKTNGNIISLSTRKADALKGIIDSGF